MRPNGRVEASLKAKCQARALQNMRMDQSKKLRERTVRAGRFEVEPTRLSGGSNPSVDGAMDKTNKFAPEARERAVRMAQEHRGEYPSPWAAVESIAPKIGCVLQT